MAVDVVTVLGTRPEIVKLSALIPLLNNSFRHRVVHSGQHYDKVMNEQIFRDLNLSVPKTNIFSRSGSFAKQAANQLKGFETVFNTLNPKIVLVQGDTNTALTAAMVAARQCRAVGHIEAGCRSFNLHSPEEQNRKMIDAISSLYFCADEEAQKNLQREGIRNNLTLTGSTVFDAIANANKLAMPVARLRRRFKLPAGAFALATLHRKENISEAQVLRERLAVIAHVAEQVPVLFAVHPHTQKVFRKHKVRLPGSVQMVTPLGYLEMISALKHARIVLTDSGGLQEEAAFQKTPCLILRGETEWNRLVKAGRNFLVPHLTKTNRTLIDRLLADDKFYRQVNSKPADFIQKGASQKIVRALKKFSRTNS